MSALRKPIYEDFLDTQAGQDWLAESVDDLLGGQDTKAPNALGKEKVLVSFIQLNEALADHMAMQRDHDYCIEQILIALSGPKYPNLELLRRLGTSAVGGTEVVNDIATELIAHKANEYRDAAIEVDLVERECGF